MSGGLSLEALGRGAWPPPSPEKWQPASDPAGRRTPAPPLQFSRSLRPHRAAGCLGLVFTRRAGQCLLGGAEVHPGALTESRPLSASLSDPLLPHPNASAEKARTVLAVETAPGELVGEQAASQPAPGPPNSINFSLKQWGAELK